MLQYAVGICSGFGDKCAGHLHCSLGVLLCFTQSSEFSFILGSSIGGTKVGVVVESDACLCDLMGEAHRKRTIADDAGHAVATQALGKSLTRCGLPVTAQTAFGRIIRRAGHRVGPCLAAGSVQFDVADDQQRVAGAVSARELDPGGGITDRESNSMKECVVDGRNTGENSGGCGHDVSS